MADHCSGRDDAAAYALHAMPDVEHDAFLLHMDGCADCRREVDELAAAVAVLPAAVEQVAPGPALKARIMAEVQREAALLAAAGPEADRPPAAAAPRERSARRRWGWLPRPALAGALAVGVLAVGVAAGTQLDGGGTSPAAVEARTVPAVVEGATGANVVLTADDAATLDVHDLAAPPEGKVYQVWLQRPDGAVRPSRTLFTPPSDGSVRVRVAEPVRDVTAVLVSAEQPGGSPTGQPTSAPVITAKL